MVRKAVRHLNLRIYAPEGRVCLSVPWQTPDAVIQQMLQQRLGWIRQQQARLRQPLRGSSVPPAGPVFVLGQPYSLQQQVSPGRIRVELLETGCLRLSSPRLLSPSECQEPLRHFQRDLLRQQIPPLLQHWQAVIGVQASAWGIRQMRTRWGSCNIGARRIWLALSLAEQPLACVEYVLVHELVHLLERYHNRRFYQLMSQFLPDWKERQARLNTTPYPIAAV